MTTTCGVVLAAGRSTRMQTFNKLTATIGGLPLVSYAVQNLRRFGAEQVVAVIGHDRARVKTAIGPQVGFAIQEEQLGTGHAAACAIPRLGSEDHVVVLFGDCPFLDAEIIHRSVETHCVSAADLTIATARLRDARALGQLCRRTDGSPERIVDARLEPTQTYASAEVFAGLSVWRSDVFRKVLPHLMPRHAHAGHIEYNLPDAVEIISTQGGRVATYSDVAEFDAIAPNEPDEFDAADAYLRTKVRGRLLANGVEIHDKQTVMVDYEVRVGSGTTIRRNVHLLGSTCVGADCELGPDTTLRNCVVGDGCVVGRGSWANLTFPPGSMASDRLAGDPLYFRDAHFLIPEDPRCCFVILPFEEPFVSLLRNVIAPTVEALGFACTTANRAAPTAIPDDIWRGINRASIVIVEASTQNENVWYELGLAHALSKRVVVIHRDSAGSVRLPFDVAHQRVLFYDPEKGNLQPMLREWMVEVSARPPRRG